MDFLQIPRSYIYGIFPISRSQVVHSPPPQGTPTDGFSCFDSSPLSVETWITFQDPESFRGCSTCWGKCGRGPDRAQPGHRDPRPPPPVSVAVLVSYAHRHRAAWATNWENRYKSQEILPHLLSCSSSRPLKSPAFNCCWVAQLLPRRAGTKQSLVDNHENQSLHSAVRKDISWEKNICLTADVLDLESVLLALLAVTAVEQGGLFGCQRLYCHCWKSTRGVSFTNFSYLGNYETMLLFFHSLDFGGNIFRTATWLVAS